MKTVVLILLVAIIISLGSGLFLLTRKDKDPRQLLNALKIRVALSIVLILFLVVSFSVGWIGPP